MFRARQKPVEELEFIRTARRLPGPAKSAVIRTHFIGRWQSTFDISLWLRTAHLMKEIIWVEIGITLFSLLIGGVALYTAQGAFWEQDNILWNDLGIIISGAALIALFVASIFLPGMAFLMLSMIVWASVSWGLFFLGGGENALSIIAVFTMFLGGAVISRTIVG